MQTAPKRELDASESGANLWLIMMKAFHAISAYSAHTLRDSGLGDSEFRILEALLHKGPLPVNTIGPKVFLTPGSISVAVDRLHARGLVSRSDSATDRRQRIVDLTTKGRRLIDRVFAAHAADLDTLTSVLSPAEHRQLTRALRKLGKHAVLPPR